MKTITLAAAGLVLALTPLAAAEQTRVEVTKATTPEEDARPNSPDVPEAFAVVGGFRRVLVFRFKHQTDLLAGIQQLVQKHQVRNAVILSAIGSVRDYQVHTVTNRDFPSKNLYLKDDSTPADILSMNGYVLDGRVHAHITLMDAEQAFGGHLEPDTHVFTFAMVTLAELSEEVDLSRFDDKTFR